MGWPYFGIPGVNDNTEGLEYKQPIPIDDFLKDRDSTPIEAVEVRSRYLNQEDRKQRVRVPFEGGYFLAKPNTSIINPSDEPIITFYHDNSEYDAANMENAEDLIGLQQVFTTVAGAGAALAGAKPQAPNLVLKNKGTKLTIPVTRQGMKDAKDYARVLREVDSLSRFRKIQIPKYSSGAVVQTKDGPIYRPEPGTMQSTFMHKTPGQGELFPEPIDPKSKDAYNQYLEWIAKKSGYDTFKLMKKEVFETWPDKDWLKAKQLWQGTQTNYVGYAEHLTAKASKKLRREKIVKKNPTLHWKQVDKELARKSRKTFDLDWLWDKDWIDEKGIRRTDGLNRGDRNAPENMSLLFNDRLKSVKDQLENVGYGSEESPGILWGTPAIRDKDGNITKAGSFRDPDKRFLIKFEDPSKRSVKKPYLRQNPGDAVVYRASNGKVIGKLGQYLDVLYPKNIKHPGTGKVINVPLDIMKKGVAQTINPNTGKLFIDIEEFREYILNERLKIILAGTTNLPSNMTKRNRYIDEFVNQDMVDLREQYPWLPDSPTITKEIEEDPSMSAEALDKRTLTPKKGPFADVTKTEQFNPRQILMDIFGPDRDE